MSLTACGGKERQQVSINDSAIMPTFSPFHRGFNATALHRIECIGHKCTAITTQPEEGLRTRRVCQL